MNDNEQERGRLVAHVVGVGSLYPVQRKRCVDGPPPVYRGTGAVATSEALLCEVADRQYTYHIWHK